MAIVPIQEREQLLQTLPELHPDDCIQIESLPSVTENVAQVLELAAALKERGAAIRSLAEGIDSTGPQGDLFLRICDALAALQKGSRDARRRDGIHRAKEEGRYKGRKPIEVDTALFDTVVARWEAGEILAREAMRELGLKPNTFYRRVKERKEQSMKEIKQAGKEIRSELREEARKGRRELDELRRQVHEEAREVKKAGADRLDAHDVERQIRRERARAEAEHHDEVRQMQRTVAAETKEMKELLESADQES